VNQYAVGPVAAAADGGAGAIVRRMREIAIRGDVIRLGQLLKLAGAIDSGAEAKELLATGVVQVNGDAEGRRGRQLHRGDVVTAADDQIRIV
jgi:ribosome-associated protein